MFKVLVLIPLLAFAAMGTVGELRSEGEQKRLIVRCPKCNTELTGPACSKCTPATK